MPHQHARFFALVVSLLALAVLAAGCGSSGPGAASGAGSGAIVAVGAENEYANVIAQVGGRYVKVTRDREQPEHRPAHLRGQPERRRRRSARRGWSSRTASATTPSWNGSSRPRRRAPSRKVIDVQKLLGLPDSTPNPHLWYKPQTMPAVAKALAADLSALAARARRLLPGQRAPRFDAR